RALARVARPGRRARVCGGAVPERGPRARAGRGAVGARGGRRLGAPQAGGRGGRGGRRGRRDRDLRRPGRAGRPDGRDLRRQRLRFADPGAYHRPYSGGGAFSIARRNAQVERLVSFDVHRDYAAARLHVGGGVERLAEWQDTERLGGVVPAVLAVLALVGVV